MRSADLLNSLSGLDLAVPKRLANQLEDAVAGDFEIIRLIARGGMGLVFLAKDLTLHRDVAIKVLLADAFTTQSEVKRFKLEARTIAALTHPHIVPVYAVREHEDLLLYIMQFVDGETLEQMIAKGPVEPAVVSDILAMVSGALDHAHEKGIIHRDVKPANIIVDRRGRAYVMDYGIAQLPDQNGLTVAGSLVGTPNYASPEQCRAKPARPQSDQYSLGVVAYEMLTGVPMFASDTMSGIIQHHLTTEPPDIGAKCPDCPEALAHVIQRMVSKSPDDRWPSLMDGIRYLDENSDSSSGGLGRKARAGSAVTTAPRVTPGGSANGGSRAGRRPLVIAVALAAVVVAVFLAPGAMAPLARLVGANTDPQVVGPVVSGAEPSAAGTEASADEPLDVPTDAPGDTPPTETPTETPADPPTGTPAETSDTPADTSARVATDDEPETNPPAESPVVTEPEVTAPPRQVTDAEPATTTPIPFEGDSASTASDEPGSVLLGTRGLAAVLYLDDVPLGAASRLRSWPLDAGEAQLSLRVDGCQAWDSTVVVPPGGELRLGYRLQSCGAHRSPE